MNWTLLEELVALHSTPGEEDAVMAHLTQCWQRAGWTVESLGRFAVLARNAQFSGKPVVLVCAHADSPGFSVQSVSDDDPLTSTVIPLGGPRMTEGHVHEPVWVSCDDGSIIQGMLRRSRKRHRHGPAQWEYTLKTDQPVQRGARVCWKGNIERSDEWIHAPFLDNRIGCFLLEELAMHLFDAECDVVLAATTNEEFLGFGADVLAHAVHPDLVFALDATYADKAQGIALGSGPVLTLSDKSVCLARCQWRALRDFCTVHTLPLQAEIYNFSGTDARAFPVAGAYSPVFPLLVATEGNHTPQEEARLDDIASLQQLLTAVCQTPDIVVQLVCGWQSGDMSDP
ncbi:MAG: hypothetical protein J5746_03370 [Victivallales bacterium]|nr:hypothetical protein [Victivallales bacterium]